MHLELVRAGDGAALGIEPEVGATAGAFERADGVGMSSPVEAALRLRTASCRKKGGDPDKKATEPTVRATA